MLGTPLCSWIHLRPLGHCLILIRLLFGGPKRFRVGLLLLVQASLVRWLDKSLLGTVLVHRLSTV